MFRNDYLTYRILGISLPVGPACLEAWVLDRNCQCSVLYRYMLSRVGEGGDCEHVGVRTIDNARQTKMISAPRR